MWKCEDKLKRKTAHFRSPLVSQKRRVLKLLYREQSSSPTSAPNRPANNRRFPWFSIISNKFELGWESWSAKPNPNTLIPKTHLYPPFTQHLQHCKCWVSCTDTLFQCNYLFFHLAADCLKRKIWWTLHLKGKWKISYNESPRIQAFSV